MRARPITSLALALAGLAHAGCLLAEEDCGVGFAFDGERCVPRLPAPPFAPGEGADGAGRGSSDAVAPLTPDAEPPPPPPPPPPDVWSEHRIALIVDRTPLALVARTPATPGADIDAVQAIVDGPRGDERIGLGGEVLGALFNDPFRGNLNLDASAVLDLPDRRVASLGAEGGFVYVGLDLDRPLRVGDAIVVVEQAENGGEGDAYELYLCRSPDSIDDCRPAGLGGPGITRFPLE